MKENLTGTLKTIMGITQITLMYLLALVIGLVLSLLPYAIVGATIFYLWKYFCL